MILDKVKLGSLQTNCYLIGCNQSKKAAVIDPGGKIEPILELARQYDLKIEYIINTHGHIDHIEGNKALKNATNAKILIHKEDSGMLRNPIMNGSMIFLGKSITSPSADKLIEQGDTIELGELKLEVLHTPGHTKGSISIKLENRVFVGDTLFHLSVGRTDLPGGSYEVLIKSIQTKFLCLPDETYIYPGHGEPTTVGIERKLNPFVV